MGLHEIAVKLGVSYTSNKEAEFKMASFIALRFREAAELFEEVVEILPHSRNFLDCLKEVWTDWRGIKFYIEDSDLRKHFPDICSVEHPIKITTRVDSPAGHAFVSHYEGSYSDMTIHTGLIDKSKSKKELKKNLTTVLATIYHECDHIYSQAKISEMENIEEFILYYLDEAELRAHSKQLAFVYYSSFPNQKFDYKKLKQLLSRYNESEKLHMMAAYLELMRDPRNFKASNTEVQDYINNRILVGGHKITVHNLKKAFSSYMDFCAYFVDYLNKHQNEHPIANS